MVNRKHTSRELEDHIVKRGSGVEINPGETVPWETVSGEVHADPIIDTSSGQKVIARRFFFQLPPGPKQVDDEGLLEWHKKNTIIPTLWRDELELVDEPRIMAGKKGKFTIVALCKPRFVLGVKSDIYEKAHNVTDIIENGKTRPNPK